MPIRRIDGDVFDTGCDLVDVTSLHRPDTTWRHVDTHGHEHRWYVGETPARSYTPSANYETPTLIDVHDGWGYYEDDERYAIHHFECRQCGEHIAPGYTADTTTQYLPGLRWYRINGKPVSEDEFKRRASQP